MISSDGEILNYAEKLCFHRCASKLYKAREVVESKLEGHIEKPPILFAQNLPMWKLPNGQLADKSILFENNLPFAC